jgi:lipoprotein-anchoring transpeptidase ErfK/SrfK
MHAAGRFGLAVLLSLAGCSSVGSPSGAPSQRPGETTPPSVSPTTTRGSQQHGPTYVAEARGRQVVVYDAPKATKPVLRLPNPWLLNGATTHPVAQWFLVLSTRPDGWVRIQLPTRPNGTSGWLAPGAARLLVDPYRLDVSLRAHRLVVWRGTTRVYAGSVATGAPATPTPTGVFYLRVLLRNDNPSSVYGPYAYGLSAHSEALTTFNGGDAEIGLHGNDDPSVLGTSVTHGCIRMDNSEITRLSTLLPLGTPVRIDA